MQDINTLLKRINILVVDDMEAIRSMVKACLRNLGALNIDIAIDGDDAWKKLNQKNYHLVVSDWDMPKMSGLQLLQKVRGCDEHKHIPFLLLTASTEKDRVISAINSGVNDYLTKPFTQKDLEYRVIKLLPSVVLSTPNKASD